MAAGLAAIGSAAVVATSICYALSPPAAAMPLVPTVGAAALAGAHAGAATMRLAGVLGMFGDVLIAGGGMALGAARLNEGRGLSAPGWFLVAVSTALFTVVDAMTGFVLAPAAAQGAGPFLAMKALFDILFLASTATFGLGAVLVAAGGMAAPWPWRAAMLVAFAAGFAAFVSATAGIAGIDLHALMGPAILAGAASFVFVALEAGR